MCPRGLFSFASVSKVYLRDRDDLRDGGASALAVLGPVPEDVLDPVAVDPLAHVHLAQVDRVLQRIDSSVKFVI